MDVRTGFRPGRQDKGVCHFEITKKWNIYSLSLALTLTVTLSPNHLIMSNFGWPCTQFHWCEVLLSRRCHCIKCKILPGLSKAARQNPEWKAWVWGWVMLKSKHKCSPYYVFHRFIMQKLGRIPTCACLLCTLTRSSQVVLAYILYAHKSAKRNTTNIEDIHFTVTRIPILSSNCCVSSSFTQQNHLVKVN